MKYREAARLQTPERIVDLIAKAREARDNVKRQSQILWLFGLSGEKC